MKKIFSFAMLLLAGAFALTSCDDDNDSNPTLVQPTEFKINSANVTSAVVDLERSNSFSLTWSLPTFTDFGAPVIPTFVVQVSPSGSFSKEFDFDAKENDGADFFSLTQTFNESKGDIDTELLDQALMQFYGWESDADVPATLPLTIRVKASVRDAGFNDYSEILSSNTVVINTAPYYIINVPPLLWYLVGDCIGSASWSNSEDGVGVGLIPLLPSGDEEYDKATGTGIISHTGFFPAGGQFKFVLTPGSWNDQLNFENLDGESKSLVDDLDGDNHNIGIRKAGYYTIKIDTKKKAVSIEEYEGSVKVVESVAMPGAYNGWDASGNGMTACETLSGENHVWKGQADFTDEGGVKFAANGAWDINWGSSAFPYGTGTQGGDNIPYTPGSYTVFLNDITGQYMFIVNE